MATAAAPPPAAFRFPVYQIDFSAVAAGKHVSSTKRRIRWRFGFPNLAALADGRTGTDCRGEEHEVVVVWSVTSGKRQILMDGKEIHYSATRTGVIDQSWSAKGNHILKVVCHAAPPLTANPGFRQYDLFIDGQSFFTMPKVYELGVRGTAERAPVRDAGYGGYASPTAPPPPVIRAPQTPQEEEIELQRAINASLEESKRHLENKQRAPPAPSQPSLQEDMFSADLLGPPVQSTPRGMMSSDFSVMSFTSAPPAVSYASPPPPTYPPAGSPPPYQPPYPGAPAAYPGAPPPPQGYPAPPPGQPMLALPSSQPPASYAPPPPSYPPVGGQSYGAPYGGGDASLIPPAPAPAAYPGSEFFAPAMHATDDPFAPKPPTHNDIANEILKGYQNYNPNGVASPTAAGVGASFGSPGSYNGGAPSPTAAAAAATPLSMNTGLIQAEDEDANLSELEKAMRKLVNIDHIDEPAEEKMKLTMKQQQEAEKKKLSSKSKPLPPAAQRVVGSGATLAQISQVKPKSSPKEGIMNAIPQPWDPNAAAAGMLVVHGAPNMGPPPLQPRGFGVVHGQQPYTYGQMPQAPPPPPQQQQYMGYAPYHR